MIRQVQHPRHFDLAAHLSRLSASPAALSEKAEMREGERGRCGAKKIHLVRTKAAKTDYKNLSVDHNDNKNYFSVRYHTVRVDSRSHPERNSFRSPHNTSRRTSRRPSRRVGTTALADPDKQPPENSRATSAVPLPFFKKTSSAPVRTCMCTAPVSVVSLSLIHI